MTTVVANIELPASPEAVWEVIMDPQRLGDWVTIHKSLREVDKGGPRVGFSMTQRLVVRGAPVNIRWKLRDFTPPNHAHWEGRGPARSHAEIEYRLESTASGTTIFHYTNTFTPPMGPLGGIAGRVLVGGTAEHEAQATLEKLRSLLTKT